MRRHAAPSWVGLLLLLVAAVALAQSPAYPPLDGTGNNKENPTWGAAGTPYLRQQVPKDAYGPKGSAMAGGNRPSARAVSLALTNSPYFKAASRYNTSYLLSALGQLVSVDINRLNAEPGSNRSAAPIPIPPGDPLFSQFTDQHPVLRGSRPALNFTRSAFVSWPSPSGPRQAINEATSFLDASCLYGDKENITQAIRAGTAGLLLDDGGRMLPLNQRREGGGGPILPMKNAAQRVPVTQLRLSGNRNVNQNPLPLVTTTLLLREHNRRALVIGGDHPTWDDEQIFNEARKWVIAHMQRITLVDYLNGLGIPLPPYPGYNASLNPTADTFFSTVAYRYGHSTIADVVLRLGADWQEHPKGHLSMAASFYNPDVVLAAGLEPLLRGLMAMPQGEVEARWAASVAGNLFGMSTVNGTDLVAINIQRGRDHGIPDYNTCRSLMGLPPAKNFSDITPDPALASTLQQLYGSVDDVDAYVGGLAEPHYQQAHVGQLFFTSIRDQFMRLRDGDFWYFENAAANKLFSAAEVDEIRKTSLRDIIIRNTNLTDSQLPQDIWTAVGASGSCANPGMGSSGAAAQQRLVTDLLNGQGKLEVVPGSQDGWLKVKLSSAGQGWLGFGVAQQGTETPMIGADMVVGRMVNGVPQVKRYHAVNHIPPEEASQASTNDRVHAASFQQSGGTVSLEFERPVAASSDAANDGTLGIPLDGPVTLIVARGPGNSFSNLATDYHGFTNREIIKTDRLFGASSSIAGVAATGDAIAKRRAHGVLMSMNFMLVMPLGALAARQLRCHWLKNPAIRASLFYVHIATQVTGLIITTVGFIIATRMFGIQYDKVAFSHGRMGVAILVLIYSQLLMGLARPAASAPTMRRHFWDVGHTLLGRIAMMLGVLNAILGIFIFVSGYGGSLAHWVGLCAASLAAINLLQYMLDRQEKFAVLKRDRELAGINNNVTAKDITGSGDAVASGSAGKDGSWISRRLTASNLKRHQAAAAAAAAQQPEGQGGGDDGVGGFGHADMHDEVGGFGMHGFEQPADSSAYGYNDPDHHVFGQQQQQQQQCHLGDPDGQFSFGPGPAELQQQGGHNFVQQHQPLQQLQQQPFRKF